MIFLKVTTQNRQQRRPKISYMQFGDWEDALTQFAERSAKLKIPWHTFQLHSISEAEYRRRNHPELPGMPSRR